MLNTVCFIEHFLSKEECINLRNQDNWENGLIGGDENNLNLNVRNSKIKWLTSFSHPEMYLKVINLFNEVNNSTYNYDLRFLDSLQLTLYNGDEEGFYGIHKDSFNNEVGDLSDRKLSLSILLSDPSEYEGGDLVIDQENKEPTVVPKKTGSAVVFPPYLRHEVTKVTKGNRFSLVAWAQGPMFK